MDSDSSPCIPPNDMVLSMFGSIFIPCYPEVNMTGFGGLRALNSLRYVRFPDRETPI